jgi:hypothetical protein
MDVLTYAERSVPPVCIPRCSVSTRASLISHPEILTLIIRLYDAGQTDHAACREFGASVCAVLSAALESEAAARRLLFDGKHN